MKNVAAAEFQELEEAQRKLREVQMKHGDTISRVNDIDNNLSELKERKESPVTTAAHKMLSGEQVTGFDMTLLLGQRDELQRTKSILDEAIRIQRAEVDGAASRFSRAAGAELRPDYRKKAHAIIKAVVALSRAISDEREFRNEMERAGVSSTLALGNGATFTKIGELKDHSSRASFYLREMIRDGWVTDAELQKITA